MIRRYAVAALAVLAVGFLVAAPAEAGGGGAKKNSTIRVKGAAAGNGIAVIPLQAVPAPATVASWVGNLAAFQAAGGRIVNPNQVVSFSVPSGLGVMAVANANFANVGDFNTGAYKADAGKTGYMKITAGNPPTIAGSADAF
ncbi:MAG: hypothetical protein WCR51_03525 [Planctomycetia bacterium]